MNARKKRKPLICIHPDNGAGRHYGKHSGYVYRCSLCGAYMGYYAPLGVTVPISKACYEYYIGRATDERKAD